MEHILVLPMSDPAGAYFHLLSTLTDDLRNLFSSVYLGVLHDTPPLEDPLYQCVSILPGLPVGEQFKILYEETASTSPPDAALHLCFIDRLAFSLQGEYRNAFLADLRSINGNVLPLLFLRSPTAWETHPRNYREIEGMATQLGRWVLGKTLDFTWCHLVIRAAQLERVIREVHNPDLSMMAEIILQTHSNIQTKEVDWLAWEDPFFLRRDAGELKFEREESRDETRKRLGYTLPTIQLLCERGMGFIARLQAEQVELPPLDDPDE